MHDRQMIDPQDALRAAINVLRDSHECGRMPNGQKLAPDAKDVHARAADCLAAMLKEAGDVADG
jgi:hypothetical protein